MFTKLLKYDLKANAGLLGLLGGCALGAGCLAAVILRLLTTHWEAIENNEKFVLILIPAILVLFFAYLAIILYSVATQFITLFRFYKSRFTDEGYLTFTLPVKASHIFLSGAVNILIWDFVAIIVVIAASGIALRFGPVMQGDLMTEFRLAFSEIFSELVTPGYFVSTAFMMLSTILYGTIVPMASVVLGSSVAKKHKVLATIGILIGFSMITSTANAIIPGTMQFLLIAAEENLSLIMSITPLVSSIVPLGITIGGYFLSIHIMKNKLNLP